MSIVTTIFCFLGSNQSIALTNLILTGATLRTLRRIDKASRVKTMVRAVTAVRFCRTAWRFYVTRKPHPKIHSVEHEATTIEQRIREILERDLPGVVREQVAGYHREKITTTTG